MLRPGDNTTHTKQIRQCASKTETVESFFHHERCSPMEDAVEVSNETAL